jgi:hypothetical protein
MTTNKLPIVILILLFIIIASCSSLRFVDLQVLIPSEISYSKKPDSLFLINSRRVVLNPRLRYKVGYYKTFVNTFTDFGVKKIKESPLIEDSTKVVKMDYYKFFDNYSSLDKQKPQNSLYCIIQAMSIDDKIDYFYDIEERLNTSFRLIYKADMQLITFDSVGLSNRNVVFADTIYYDFPNRVFFYPDSFEKEKAFYYKVLGEEAAVSFTHKLLPNWQTEQRVLYYMSNKYMRIAYDSYYNNHIYKAIKEWKQVYNSSTRNIASKAAHNIALCYEMQDSIEVANDWIKKSVDLKKQKESLFYKGVLAQRLKEVKKLETQLNN